MKKVPKLKQSKDYLAHRKTKMIFVGVEAWNSHTEKKVYIVAAKHDITGPVSEFKTKKAALKIYKDLRKR